MVPQLPQSILITNPSTPEVSHVIFFHHSPLSVNLFRPEETITDAWPWRKEAKQPWSSYAVFLVKQWINLQQVEIAVNEFPGRSADSLSIASCANNHTRVYNMNHWIHNQQRAWGRKKKSETALHAKTPKFPLPAKEWMVSIVLLYVLLYVSYLLFANVTAVF